MFGSSKKDGSSGEIETVIGKNTQIKGDIYGTGNVRIDGHVAGGIAITGEVIVGGGGSVVGDIRATALIVSGSVTGNAEISENLCINSTGQLVGDVKVKSLNISDGGIFRGRSEMDVRTDPAPAKA